MDTQNKKEEDKNDQRPSLCKGERTKTECAEMEAGEVVMV